MVTRVIVRREEAADGLSDMRVHCGEDPECGVLKPGEDGARRGRGRVWARVGAWGKPRFGAVGMRSLTRKCTPLGARTKVCLRWFTSQRLKTQADVRRKRRVIL